MLLCISADAHDTALPPRQTPSKHSRLARRVSEGGSRLRKRGVRKASVSVPVAGSFEHRGHVERGEGTDESTRIRDLSTLLANPNPAYTPRTIPVPSSAGPSPARSRTPPSTFPAPIAPLSPRAVSLDLPRPSPTPASTSSLAPPTPSPSISPSPSVIRRPSLAKRKPVPSYLPPRAADTVSEEGGASEGSTTAVESDAEGPEACAKTKKETAVLPGGRVVTATAKVRHDAYMEDIARALNDDQPAPAGVPLGPVQ